MPVKQDKRILLSLTALFSAFALSIYPAVWWLEDIISAILLNADRNITPILEQYFNFSTSITTLYTITHILIFIATIVILAGIFTKLKALTITAASVFLSCYFALWAVYTIWRDWEYFSELLKNFKHNISYFSDISSNVFYAIIYFILFICGIWLTVLYFRKKATPLFLKIILFVLLGFAGFYFLVSIQFRFSQK